MGWRDRLKEIAGIATPIVTTVIPATPITRIIERVIADPTDPRNLTALRQLAAGMDALELRLARLEEALAELKTRKHKEPFMPDSTLINQAADKLRQLRDQDIITWDCWNKFKQDVYSKTGIVIAD
jgi:hypothetical protein